MLIAKKNLHSSWHEREERDINRGENIMLQLAKRHAPIVGKNSVQQEIHFHGKEKTSFTFSSFIFVYRLSDTTMHLHEAKDV